MISLNASLQSYSLLMCMTPTACDPCPQSISVADHPLGLATDHRLCKLLPHQLANQTRALPQAGSSFCSSGYGVLAAVSSRCSPPKGRHNLYPCASYSPRVCSQKYGHPYPLTSIQRASYPFLFDHGEG
ncbi:hypothetical protein GOBAR_DD17481 [Gossypium barbadense]|nr:hypothetical protein GOBAR_DD17481 [Gossypium barbadense]